MLIKIDDDVPASLLGRALASCGFRLKSDGLSPPRLTCGEGLKAEIAECGASMHLHRAIDATAIINMERAAPKLF